MALGDVTMELRAEERGDITVIAIRGRVSIGRVDELNAFFQEHLDRGALKFIFDLGDMEHIVSGGIGVFIGFNERLKKSGGHARMANVHPRVQKIFQMMSLDAFFKIFDGIEDAQKSF